MNETIKAYAVALFSLAKERNNTDEMMEALRMVRSLIRQTPEYIEVLASPAIKKEERIELLERAFQASVPADVMSFLKVLCEHGDIRALEGCINEYETLDSAARGLSTASVTSAVPLTEAEKSRLIEQLRTMTGHDIRMECNCNEDLIGGMVIRVDDRILDGSLKRRLQEIKEVMKQ